MEINETDYNKAKYLENFLRKNTIKYTLVGGRCNDIKDSVVYGVTFVMEDIHSDTVNEFLKNER